MTNLTKMIKNGSKNPVFWVKTGVLGSKTGVSKYSKLMKILKFALFQTFQKVHKNDIKIEL